MALAVVLLSGHLAQRASAARRGHLQAASPLAERLRHRARVAAEVERQLQILDDRDVGRAVRGVELVALFGPVHVADVVHDGGLHLCVGAIQRLLGEACSRG